MSWVTSRDGTRIAYEQVGTGPPLVLVDAAGHYRANSPFGELAELLAEDFAVYHYDRRGRGESTDTPPYTPAREVEDLSALIAEIGTPICFYGFSSGCLVGLHAAATGLDIRRLALLEPPLDLTDDSAEQQAFTAKLRELSGVDAVEFFLTSIGVPADVLVEMRGTPDWEAMVSVAHTLVYDSVLSEATNATTLSRVLTPTLILDSAGSSDDLAGMAAAAARLLPNAKPLSLPGEWHTVAAPVLAPVLAEFLREP
ncbi:alpha/beta fold hydrolase [Cryptosporangium minutisporangium]|uniref:Alpha/beta hydrolase n=1 Tax=Cryptosporangium minutisporangium TaxID=113569 RepID=A0ABP6T112_9ACTN